MFKITLKKDVESLGFYTMFEVPVIIRSLFQNAVWYADVIKMAVMA